MIFVYLILTFFKIEIFSYGEYSDDDSINEMDTIIENTFDDDDDDDDDNIEEEKSKKRKRTSNKKSGEPKKNSSRKKKKTNENNNNSNNSNRFAPRRIEDNGLIRVVRNQDEINEAIRNKEETKEIINEMFDLWTYPQDGNLDNEYFKWCLERFEIEDINNYSIHDIELKYITLIETCGDIYKRAVLCGLCDDGEPINYGIELDPDHETYSFKIGAVSSRIDSIKQMIISLFQSKQLSSPYDYNSIPCQEYYVKHVDPDTRPVEDLTDSEIIFKFIKNRFYKDNKRKKGRVVYQQIYNKKGIPTMAWEPMRETLCDIEREITIDDYIQNEIAKELYICKDNILYVAYSTMSAHKFSQLASKIEMSKLIEFKNINTSRRIFSFENGAYITCTNKFLVKPYTKYDKNFHEYLEDAFFEYETQKLYFRKIGDEECHEMNMMELINFLPDNDENDNESNQGIKLTKRMRMLTSLFDMVACNHLEGIRFPVEYMSSKIEDWREIPTPTYDYFFEYQDIPKDATDYLTAMNGRTLHEVGEFDDAQLHVQYKGSGGSGKSFALKIIKKIFGAENTGTISDKMEETFSLGYLAEKLVYIIPEVSKNLGLTQQLFQSMISGESIYKSRKNVDPSMKDWKINGLSAGNFFVPFLDTTGNIMRRFIFVIFNKVYEGNLYKDISFETKIDEELGYILLKMNRAYLSLVKKEKFNTNYKASKHYPKYFVETSRIALEENNILPRFISERLKTEKYIRDEESSLLLSLFKRDFDEYKKGKTKYDPTNSELVFVLKQYDLTLINMDTKNAAIKGIRLNSDNNDINNF